MEIRLGSRIKNAWNVFFNKDPTLQYGYTGMSSSHPPTKTKTRRGGDKSIATAIFNRIAMDAAAIEIKHVKLDDKGRFSHVVNDPLNECLTVEANIDQSARAFRHDVYMSLLDEGVIAIVPIDTDDDINQSGSFDIYTMRVGQILEWYPDRVKCRVYNERTGLREDIIVSKRGCTIVENPLYAVINEQNSMMQRLMRKLNLLDVIDEQSSSGKLDLIIQLPYVIKSDTRRAQAEKRRKDIEEQLTGSRYGIAYTDGTERITQLNRPVENNLMKQIEYLTSMLHGQLGITQSVMDGTANEMTMLNYENRTIEHLVSAVVDGMVRTFLTKTARSKGHTIMAFRDPFKNIPFSQLADVGDKFTRNAILSSNEIRVKIGYKPSDDPEADKLKNKNIRDPGGGTPSVSGETNEVNDQNGE